MEYFLETLYLPIFPDGALANSIITTVWVGIMVVAFFNLRYGWILSGLVVPGYITPLLLVKPLAVWVIGVESLVVYLLVYLFSEKFSKYGLWGSFFGRDRFFAILLISVVVRVFFDGWFLPIVGEWYVNYTGEAFDYRNNLHSFGLIIIALIANMLWKPGLIRGLPPVVIIVAVTYLITRFILVEHTNFTLSNLSYMYEDFSSNILASPKSYIILLTTAFIASRMNLRYGWDFNGILIPSLLALQWYQPSKIVISFVEALAIYGLALVVLKLPIFKKINVEGARKIFLFFNIGFLYKIFISVLITKFFPEVKVSDYFGFGYLLSTLIAIKMYDKDIIALFIRATLQTSFISIIVASTIGFFLTIGSETIFKSDIELFSTPKNLEVKSVQSLDDYLLKEKINLYDNLSPESFKAPTEKELNIFYRQIKDLLKAKTEKEGREILSKLSAIGIGGVIAENRYVVLTDLRSRGWGIYVIDLQSTSQLLISNPAPLDEWGSYESAMVFFKTLGAKGFSIAGTKRETNTAGTSDVLKNRFTLFYKFHEVFNKENTLVVRGYTTNSARKIFAERYDVESFDNNQIENITFIDKQLPNGVSLLTLKNITKGLEIHWEEVPDEHIFNSGNHQRYMEIFLTKNSRRSMMATLLKTRKLEAKETYQRIDGYFQQWILEEKDAIAKKGSEKYQAPTKQELLYFDNEVLTPLFQFVIDSRKYKRVWDKNAEESLNSIASAASIVNYKLIHYHHIASKQDYMLLLENSENRTYRGSYAIRFGESNGYVIQVPRPLFEKNTFEFGVSTFERSQGMAILIGGTHPNANSDKSSDLLKYSNKGSFYNLFNQVLLREIKDEEILTILARAFSNRTYAPTPETDVVISFDKGYISQEELSSIGRDLVNFLRSDGLDVSLTDGKISKSGYEVTNITQALYLPQTTNKEFALIWLSPDIRSRYRQVDIDSFLLRSLRHLGLKVVNAPFEEWSRGSSFVEGSEKIYQQLLEYSTTRDPIILVNLLESGEDIEVLFDITTKMSFLVYKNGKSVSAIVKLQKGSDGSSQSYTKEEHISSVLNWVYSKETMLKVPQ